MLAGIAIAQNEISQWILGATCNVNDPNRRATLIDFRDIPPTVSGICSAFKERYGMLVMCNENGDLLFYSNGARVADRNHDVMPNGDSLSINPYWDNSGQYVPQCGLIVKQPGSNHLYHMFHYNSLHYTHYWNEQLLYSVIDMDLRNGLGDVVEKNIPLVTGDSLYLGHLTACRHANGRDWWVLVPQYMSNEYKRFLVDPTGIHQLPSQYIGDATAYMDGIGQAAFSPNGDWYARNNNLTDCFLFRFDRCDGTLSEYRHLSLNDNYPQAYAGGGISFSPSSRFLYPNSWEVLYQFDLQAQDIPSSRIEVAMYDGFQDPFPNTFHTQAIAPNGKTYMSCQNSSHSIHVLHHADRPDTNCGFVHHSFGMYLNNFNNVGIPHFPNYQLGPIDGSICDSLGLDQALAVHDAILDFGEVVVGQDSQSGLWLRNLGETALTLTEARNDSAAFTIPLPLPVTIVPGDSIWLPVVFAPTRLGYIDDQITLFHNGILGLSTVWIRGIGVNMLDVRGPVATSGTLTAWPNPATSQVHFTRTGLPQGFEGEVRIVDVLGRPIISVPFANGLAVANIEALPTGVYIATIWHGGELWGSVRLVRRG